MDILNGLMMFYNKIVFGLLILVATSGSIHAQQNHVDLSANVAYNSFSFIDLGKIQSQLISSYFPDGSLTYLNELAEFPPHYGAGLSLGKWFGEIKFSLRYSYQSTGSRYHYSDYSSEMVFNSVIYSHFGGIEGLYKLNLPSNKLDFYAGGSLSKFFGKYSFDGEFSIGDNFSSSSDHINVDGTGVEIFSRIKYRLREFFVFFDMGYLTVIDSNMEYRGETNEGPNKPIVEWDGLRLRTGVGVSMNYNN
ncbi:MAG: hypothetical protein ACQETE_11360 [Bacteroidota bacterium]